ncbi:MAG: hypothetical protein ACE5FL_13880 [Myxococcota bacterium]
MASFALALSLPLLLWWGYQSHRDLGGSLVASYAAANYFKGNNEAMTAFYPFVDVDHMTPHMREMKAQAASTGRDPALDLVRRALEFQRSSPLDTLALVPRKLAAFFVPIRFPLGSGEVQRAADGEWEIVGYRPIRLRRHLLGIAALPGIVCFFIALTRIRRLPPAVQFSTLLVLSTAGIHLVTFAQTRFRLPFDPILAVSFVAIASARRARATGGGPSTP